MKWHLSLAVVLLAFGTIYSTVYLRLPSRWWFEDDPTLFAYTSTIHNPASIFADPEVLRHLTIGAALVPMQVLSYWVDIKLAGFSPRWAYTHQVLSFLLTLMLLYALLVQVLHGDAMAAFAGSLVWCLLPATAVVLQSISTRHYMEGLLFCVLSIYLAERLRDNGCLRWRWKAAVLSAAAIAMLCKETYAPVVPALLLISAWRHRDRVLALLATALACAYALYRCWVFGLGLRYGELPLLTPSQYVKFLPKLPYTLSSNFGGYGLLAAVAALCAYGAFRRRRNLAAVFCFVGIYAISLLAILPVSDMLYGMTRRPDSRYRIVFVLNTIVAVFGTYFAARWAPRRVQGVLAIAALAMLLPGVEKTRELWVDLTSKAELEGKFYVANPDKMLLSEVAWWFIPGVEQLYGDHRPHYVLMQDLASAKIDPGTPLWRLDGGIFVPAYDVESLVQAQAAKQAHSK
jgi:Dolichyl-phosphate-mannose-protein mannosyltransferase